MTIHSLWTTPAPFQSHQSHKSCAHDFESHGLNAKSCDQHASDQGVMTLMTFMTLFSPTRVRVRTRTIARTGQTTVIKVSKSCARGGTR